MVTGLSPFICSEKKKQKAKNVGIGIGVAVAVAIGFCRPIQPTATATPIPIPIPTDIAFSSLFDTAKGQPTYELIGMNTPAFGSLLRTQPFIHLPSRMTV